jgi:hypothetical protein
LAACVAPAACGALADGAATSMIAAATTAADSAEVLEAVAEQEQQVDGEEGSGAELLAPVSQSPQRPQPAPREAEDPAHAAAPDAGAVEVCAEVLTANVAAHAL